VERGTSGAVSDLRAPTGALTQGASERRQSQAVSAAADCDTESFHPLIRKYVNDLIIYTGFKYNMGIKFLFEYKGGIQK